MRAQVTRWGNSLALRLPKSLADRLGVAEGSAVDLSEVDGELVVRPRRPEPRLDELLAGITPKNLPASCDDAAMGHEAL